mmetsp:Transcript_14070/g.36132  ORF Transcript_14070/g.36132 Transcript_14070/m.36132 type:complete len:369 (-) Transcript_14070:103-1209(-)
MATTPSLAGTCAPAAEARGSRSAAASSSYPSAQPEHQQAPQLHHRRQQALRLHYVWPVPPKPATPVPPAVVALNHASTQTDDAPLRHGKESSPSHLSSLRCMELDNSADVAPHPSYATPSDAPNGFPQSYGGLAPSLYAAMAGEQSGETVLLSPSTSRRHLSLTGDTSAQSPYVVGADQQGCTGSKSAILQRLTASWDQSADCALLGPVSCSELYVLADLLRRDLCRVRWLYVAVQDPYRKGEFSQRATHAIADLADALSTNNRLQGLILRMPQFELGNKQLTRILTAFTHALHSNRNLMSLQFKPPGFFCKKGADFEPLVKAGRLSEQSRVAFLSGTHACLGAQSPVSSLPKEVLMRIVDYCHCAVG